MRNYIYKTLIAVIAHQLSFAGGRAAIEELHARNVGAAQIHTTHPWGRLDVPSAKCLAWGGYRTALAHKHTRCTVTHLQLYSTVAINL